MVGGTSVSTGLGEEQRCGLETGSMATNDVKNVFACVQGRVREKDRLVFTAKYGLKK